MEPTPPLSPPLKSRVVKHQPEGFIDSSKTEIVAVKAIHWSFNSDPRATAREDFQSIVGYCSANESHHLLEDLTVEAEYNDYIVGNETANDAYRDGFSNAQASRFKQNLEERAAATGPTPATTSAFGVSGSVHNAIKAVLNDPDSYKYIGVSGPWTATHSGVNCWLEKVQFRARNAFNALVTETASVWVNRLMAMITW